MPAGVDATVGGAASNAYLDVADADALMAERIGSSAWDSATADEKARAIITATRRLDQEAYVGRKADPDQALEWPRFGLRLGGYAVPADALPGEIVRATADLALALVASPSMLDASGLEGFESVKVGPLDVTPRDGVKAGDLPDHVRREIRPFLEGGGSAVRLRRG